MGWMKDRCRVGEWRGDIKPREVVPKVNWKLKRKEDKRGSTRVRSITAWVADN